MAMVASSGTSSLVSEPPLPPEESREERAVKSLLDGWWIEQTVKSALDGGRSEQTMKSALVTGWPG